MLPGFKMSHHKFTAYSWKCLVPFLILLPFPSFLILLPFPSYSHSYTFCLKIRICILYQHDCICIIHIWAMQYIMITFLLLFTLVFWFYYSYYLILFTCTWFCVLLIHSQNSLPEAQIPSHLVSKKYIDLSALFF